jgi:hypothetical protein
MSSNNYSYSNRTINPSAHGYNITSDMAVVELTEAMV